MADENQAQEPGQEQEAIQAEDPVQEPAEKPKDKPVKEKRGDGLLMPILYALLAAVGAFTLVMIIGIVLTFIIRPAQSPESPSAEPSAQAAQTQSHQPPDSDGFISDAAV